MFARARSIVDRVSAQPFGVEGEGAPLAGDVALLFSQAEGQVPVTLLQLAESQPDGIYEFTTTDADLSGTWSVVVDHDIDGDGAIAGDLETSDDVLRVVVRYDGRDVLRAVKARPL